MQKHFLDDLENSKGINPEASRKLLKAIHEQNSNWNQKVKKRRVIL
jgi:hypothetical protein